MKKWAKDTNCLSSLKASRLYDNILQLQHYSSYSEIIWQLKLLIGTVPRSSWLSLSWFEFTCKRFKNAMCLRHYKLMISGLTKPRIQVQVLIQGLQHAGTHRSLPFPSAPPCGNCLCQLEMGEGLRYQHGLTEALVELCRRTPEYTYICWSPK